METINEVLNYLDTIPSDCELFYRLKYNKTSIVFDEKDRFVTKDEIFEIIDAAEKLVKPNINNLYLEFPKFEIKRDDLSLLYWQSADDGNSRSGVFALSFTIINTNDILANIEQLESFYKKMALEKFNKNKHCYPTFGALKRYMQNDIKNTIKTSLYQKIDAWPNAVDIEIDDLTLAIKTSLDRIGYPVDDFDFYTTCDESILNIRHCLLDEDLEINLIKRVEYDAECNF